MFDETHLNEHEKLYRVKPEWIGYTCEFCNEGEMITDTTKPGLTNRLYPHVCNKCGKEMLLPRMYPFIRWVRY